MIIFMCVLIHSIESTSLKNKNKVLNFKSFYRNDLNNHNNDNDKIENWRDIVNNVYDGHFNILNYNNNNFNSNNNFKNNHILNNMLITSLRTMMNARMIISLSVVVMSILLNPIYCYAGIYFIMFDNNLLF